MNDHKNEAKRGLGQGLSAILGPENFLGKTESFITKNDLVQELALDHIKPNPQQPRRSFKEEEIQELTQSILRTGVLQPIIVREIEKQQYEIVAGERRWRAAQQANLTHIPAVIKELDDAQAFTIALVENIQRSDLNVIEEADGYHDLIERMNFTQDKIADMLGKSRSHVANILRLKTLSKYIRSLVINGDLSAGHAKTLVGIDNAEGIADLIVKRQLNVRQTERLIRRLRKQEAQTEEELHKLANAIMGTEIAPVLPEHTNGGASDGESEKIQTILAQALPFAQVEFHMDGKKPFLKIQFHNLGDLDTFLDKLM